MDYGCFLNQNINPEEVCPPLRMVIKWNKPIVFTLLIKVVFQLIKSHIDQYIFVSIIKKQVACTIGLHFKNSKTTIEL